MIAKDVYSFYFQNLDFLKWRAGQYIQLFIPHDNADSRGIKRFFTISSAPFETDIVITTRIEPESSSTFKKAMLDLKIGYEAHCSEPKGKFIAEDLSREIIFIAGGIGITPIRAIILDLVHNQKKFQADLLYANRDTDFCFSNELEQAGSLSRSFKIYYFVPPKFICEEELDKIYETYEDKNYYLSGPINMIKAIEEIFYKKGITDKNIKTDYFPGYD